MILGLINCSSKKLPVPGPAWLVYSASPRFVQQYQYLVTVCDEVRIISAKYGFLGVGDIISPYNLTVESLGSNNLRSLAQVVQKSIIEKHPTKVISLLSSKYSAIIDGLSIPIENMDKVDLYSLAKYLGPQKDLIRGRIKVCFPIYDLLNLVASKGPVTKKEIVQFLVKRGYPLSTIKAQIYRVFNCPLHRVTQLGVVNPYVDAHQDFPVRGFSPTPAP